MQNRRLIQIQDDPQEIHYFLYKDRRYPFNMDIFKASSKYFSNNPEKIQQDRTINLIDESSEVNIIFTEESIDDFIKYSQRQQIFLTNENAVALNYLSKKYEINSLIEITNQYIEEFRKDLILQLISVYQNEETFCTENYEHLISDNLEYYINDDLMLTLDISIIYRILSEFESKQNQEKTNNLDTEIIDFLFRCLSNYGRKASILFSLIDVSKLSSEKLNALYNDYSNIFDFHFINPSFLKTIYEYQIELFQKEEQNKTEIENEIVQLKQENRQMKENQATEVENKKKIEFQITQLKQENQKSKENQAAEVENKKKIEIETAQMKQEIQQMKEYQSKQRQAEEENQKLFKEELDRLKQEIEQLRKDQQMQTETQKQKEEEIKKKSEDEITKLKQEIKQIKEENKKYIEDQQLFQNKIIDFIFMINNLNTGLLKIYSKMKTNLDDTESIESYVTLLFFLQKNDKQAEKMKELVSHSKIKIIGNMTEELFKMNKLKSHELMKYVNNFSEFIIEIKYPSDIFEDIYSQVLEIKHSNPKQVRICIFITGIETKDSFFKGNKDIDYITFDSCVKSIGSSDEDAGSFEGCSSLTHVEVPSTIEFIEPHSFKNCTSLSSISIPSRENKIKMSVFDGCSSLTRISTPFTVKSIPVPNIDDYEITQLIDTNNNDIFKGVNKNTGQTVVIKSLSASKDFNLRVDFILGANISQINLPGIVKIQSFRYPLTDEEKRTCKLQKYEENKQTIDLTGYIAISEFLENGNIYEITKKYLKSEGKENEKMNPTIRSKIIFGISATMKSLHKRKIIHRNLTHENILLDDKLEPRIGSFSLARFVDDPIEIEMGIGTTCSMAPELFVNGFEPYSFPVDVFAYSFLLYRMFSVKISFIDINHFKSPQEYLMKIGSGCRPVRPSLIPDHYWELIQKCWKRDPADRPTFEEITDILRDDKYALEEFGMKTDLEQLHEYQQRIDIG